MSITKRGLLVVLALLTLSAQVVIQAQDDCDLQTVAEYMERGDESYFDADYEGAIADYGCAIALDPTYTSAYNYRGDGYYHLNLFDLALEDYLTATRLDPNNSYAFFNVGFVYYVQGDYASAIEAASQSIALDDSHSGYYLLRSFIYQEQGRYDEALSDVNATIALGEDSNTASAYLTRAWIYLSQNGVETPHADFLRWIELTETTTTTQTLDDAIQGGNLDISEGHVYRLSFEAQAGQIFSVAATSDDLIDPLLVLVAPDGTPIDSDDDGGINLNAVVQRDALPQSGTYTLVISQAGAYGTGTVQLSVFRDGQVSSSDASDENINANFARYNLFVDEVAEVFTTGNDRLNLRSGPGLDYEIVDKLERGEEVTLLEGPRKESGYSWWRVRADDGAEGWAVERVETEQTLHLALIVGEEALVISGDEKLNVRVAAQRGAELLFQLEDGAIVTLLEDPVIADNFRWWHIRDADEREGWVVDRIGVERMLAPVREFPDR